MPRYMLDTNICIYIQKQKPRSVLERFRNTAPGDAVMSAITWGELIFGAQKSTRSVQVIEQLEEFRTIVPVSPLHQFCGAAYGKIRWQLQAKGLPIGNNDLWIAAHALAENLTIVTNNEREFARVDGLKLENWVEG